ncbi:MAG: 2-polyprenyl-3-methyl-6-methoxy-1,4-benzoquinone monooxygenase [Gammaproteobacteria bacterium]|nr:2-polyprenyl-3-methyl-6-methoxy-1,4-benzoquinone monooxygenase [Gammaproteobacteria bacterium]MCZ6855920.1 2-polyprenyl-3-methyl-6-methoxy-1,4-benzoquinone monooxygenase [Gammaproteobacteria bacterium]
MALVDEFITRVDQALKTLTGKHTAIREYPAVAMADSILNEDEAQHAAGLMRVNHTGEICAQALYEGQVLTARKTEIKKSLKQAADEESDHLAWCEQRLDELGGRPSVLNPLFYAASYAMGAITGLLGDRVSLGFVEATEDQVCRHLERHLASLPEGDERSREIVRRMREDEARHGTDALRAGGKEFPEPVKRTMALISRVMTETTYRV